MKVLEKLMLGTCYEWVVPEFILWDILNIYEECYGDKERCLILWSTH